MRNYVSIKKCFSILMLIILSVTLLACGNKKDQEAVVQTNNNDVQENNVPKKVTALDEIINLEMYGDKIQIQDKIMNIPATYSDFADAGAIITSKDITEDYLMDSKSKKSIDMLLGYTAFTIEVQNNTDDRIALKESDVVRIENTRSEGIFYSKGIHIGSTLDELNEKWGKPTLDESGSSRDELKYTYYEDAVDYARFGGITSKKPISATGNEYIVLIDKNTSAVKNIQYKWAKCKDPEKIKNFSIDLKSEKKVFFEIPNYLVQNPVASDKVYLSVCMIDNIPYVIKINTEFIGAENKDGINDDNITKVINGRNSEWNYNVEVIKKTDSDAWACGYLKNDNSLKAVAVHMTNDSYYNFSQSMIAPLDPNQSLSDSAISKFKDIMSTFATSIH